MDNLCDCFLVTTTVTTSNTKLTAFPEGEELPSLMYAVIKSAVHDSRPGTYVS